MKFHLIADATFEAANIDDALRRLSEHFRQLTEGSLDDSDTDQFFDGGSIEVGKCPGQDEPK